jgi:hypothetical protein
MQERLKAEADDGLIKTTLTQEMVRQINGDSSTRLPGSWSQPVWWNTVSNSSLPNYQGPLAPGKYHIKLGDIPMSFSVSEGWQCDLFAYLPYAFSITSGGAATAGSIVTFRNVREVVDPDKFREVIDPENPGSFATAVSAKPPDLHTWFSERCSGYLKVGEAEKIPPSIGGASGQQFEVSVLPGKGIRDVPGAYAPFIPTFPNVNPRDVPSFLPEGYKNLLIVLDVAGKETIAIIVLSPPSEVEAFRARARSVLDTVQWPDQKRHEEAQGDT